MDFLNPYLPAIKTGLPIAGAIGGGLVSSLWGGRAKSEKIKQLSTLAPQQQQVQNQLSQFLQGAGPQAQNYLQDLLGGGEESFKRFAAPYQQQFEQYTLPSIAERYAGYGAGAQSSSAFQQALGQSGSDLQMQLASLREGLRGQAFGQYQQLLGQGLHPTLENILRPGRQSGFQNFLGQLPQYFAGGLGGNK